MFPVTGAELTRLIPQKPPFVFITSLESVSEAKAHTRFIFDENHTLCHNGHLTAAGVLEHIAQSAGCKSGYANYASGKPGRRGFIGEIKNFICVREPKAGERLDTEITLDAVVYGVVNMVSAKTLINGEEIASCAIKIFFESAEATG